MSSVGFASSLCLWAFVMSSIFRSKNLAFYFRSFDTCMHFKLNENLKWSWSWGFKFFQFALNWRWQISREWEGGQKKIFGRNVDMERAAVFRGRRDQKGTRKRTLGKSRAEAETEYYEWIYENGKFTEISAAHWCHVFLRGWCDGSSEKVEFLKPIRPVYTMKWVRYT